jgi:tetratricopeptide (TPR) repeat protein
MKLLVPMFVFVAGVCSLLAQSQSPVLMPGLGQHHHTISTKSPEAQRFFDQGLTLVFAFNHEEAVRAFRRAAELDPQSAMSFWGIALALGPCINLDVDAPHEKAAYEAVQKAVSLAPGVTESERAYIQALAKRYSADPKIDFRKLHAEYAHAMLEVSKRYPDDLDAATLYAESLMDLRPWKLWSLDGHPADDTDEIVAVLESVLRRDPTHIGANHYYIHAVEASTHPERALASARRLETLAPAAGHLVHMPAHIYFRAGDYRAAARSNALAAEIDRVYLRESGTIGSMYDILYYAHNLQFLAAAYSMEGRFADAKQAADDLAAHIGPMVLADMAMAEPYVPTPIFVLLRFHRWDEVLKTPPPDSHLAMTAAFWHFARGSAAAAKGQIGTAELERGKLEAARKEMPADREFSMFSNKAQAFLDLAANILDARIATAHADRQRAIEHWKNAVQIEDRLYYGEPPEWFYPVRESLGSALLRNGQADQAEAVFRADLEQYPRNPRSLFGLLKSLEAQKKTSEAEWVRREFEAAWKVADVPLEIGDL